MKKLKLFAVALLASFSVGAMAETTLFSTNFSDAIWSDHSTICGGTVSEDTINGIIFRSAADSKSFSIADGALTFCDNNIGDKYYMLIHLVGVNEKVNVAIGTVSNGQRISYKWFEQSERPTSSSSATATAANINTAAQIELEYSMTGEGNEVWLMIGRQGSGMGTVIKSILITTQDGSAPVDPDCTEADATFAATSTAIAIAADATSATTTLTFTKGDNTNDATFDVLKGGNATTDASVADGVFTATAAGEYVVKASQAADDTYCQVVKEVTITVTDNRPMPTVLFYWKSDGSTTTLDEAQEATGGTLTLKTTDSGKSWSTESLTFGSDAATDMVAAKGHKSGGNALYMEIDLDENLEAGDIVYISGYKAWDFGTTQGGHDIFDDLETNGTGNKVASVGNGTVPDGINTNKIYVMRGTATSMTLAAIKIVRPVDDGVAKLNVNVESVDLNVTAEVANPSAQVTFSGKNLTAGTYNLNVPAVDGLTVAPQSVTVGEDGKLNAVVTISFASDDDVEAASANISLTIGELSKTVAVNYSAVHAKAYSTSLNIEQFVLDYGTKADIAAAFAAANIEYAHIDALDSLNDEEGKVNRNEAYLGLKVKTTGGYIKVCLEAGKTLKVKFGNIADAVKVTINGEAQADHTEGVYELEAADADRFVTFATSTSGTVVFKQIMVNEEIANVVLPESETVALDNVNAAEHAVKFVENGQIFILKNGVRYNALGAVVE